MHRHIKGDTLALVKRKFSKGKRLGYLKGVSKAKATSRDLAKPGQAPPPEQSMPPASAAKLGDVGDLFIQFRNRRDLAIASHKHVSQSGGNAAGGF